MTTKTRTRPSRVKRNSTSRSQTSRGKYISASRSNHPRYTSSSSRSVTAAQPQNATSEQGWFIFMMYVALALGILFIGAITYVIIFG